MTKTRELPREEWAELLDKISRHGAGRDVMVEVDALAIGAQIEAEHVALLGLSYDPKDDAVQVMLPGIEHQIEKPVSIYVAYEGVAITAIEIVGTDGAHHIVRPEKPF